MHRFYKICNSFVGNNFLPFNDAIFSLRKFGFDEGQGEHVEAVNEDKESYTSGFLRRTNFIRARSLKFGLLHFNI